MERWSGKVAVVTGASSGIGLATAKLLLKHGLIVVNLDKNKTQMEDFEGPGRIYYKECDVTKEDSVIEAFNWVKSTLGTVNILINNAGYFVRLKIEDTQMKDIEQMINVNVKGLIYCTLQAIKMMKDNQDEAHIVNLNSEMGLCVNVGGVSIYPATKHAVKALTQSFGEELLEYQIRVSSISPNKVRTQMTARSIDSNGEMIFGPLPSLYPIDVGNAIVQIIAAPPHVLIKDLSIEAIKHV